MDPKSTGPDSGGTALADLDRAWRAFDGRAHRDDDRVVSSWDSFLALCDAMKALAALTPAPQPEGLARILCLPYPMHGYGVCVGGRYDGWLMWQHPDGHWVSKTKLGADNPAKGLPAALAPTPTAPRSASRSWQEPTDLDPAFSEWSRNASKDRADG